MINESVLFAFSLTLFAGLSTGIGSLMAFFSKKFRPKFLAATLGFSAGVMIYISLVEILGQARISLASYAGDKLGYLYSIIAFFIGIVLMAILDKVIPQGRNPHEMQNMEKKVKKIQISHKCCDVG